VIVVIECSEEGYSKLDSMIRSRHLTEVIGFPIQGFQRESFVASLLKNVGKVASNVYQLAVSADGQRAMSASRDKALKIWDVANGEVLQTLSTRLGTVSAIALTPDGGRACVALRDGTLRIWDLKGRVRAPEKHIGERPVHSLEKFGESILSVALSADGRSRSRGRTTRRFAFGISKVASAAL
jgi:WD40 repeat protein